MHTNTIRFDLLRLLVYTTGYCLTFAEKSHIDMIILETILTIDMTLKVQCFTFLTEEKIDMTHRTTTHSLHFLHSLLHR